jgi:undecaprenyl-diphosphatase
MPLWNFFVAVILGVVEGLTEFAPVSSTGHMVLVDNLWLHSEVLYSADVSNTFEVVIQLGAILAVVILFRQRFLNLLGLVRLPPELQETLPLAVVKPELQETLPLAAVKAAAQGKAKVSKFGWGHILVGMLPAGILGFAFSDFIDEHLFSVPTVLGALIVGALLMIAADLFRPRIPTTSTIDSLTLPKAFFIGVFQCLSLWPGFSRSGSTISTGVLLGLSYQAASDFSFLMSVPIMLAASALSLVKHLDTLNAHTLPFFGVGFVIAFFSALLAIHFFLKLIAKVKLVPFAIYRLLLSAILLVVLFSH